MYELKKIGKVLTSKSVGTGPSSYKKRIYRAAVSQRLRNVVVERLLVRSSVCPSVFLHVSVQLPLDGFRWNILLVASIKCVEKTQIALKSGRNIGHFTFQLLPATYFDA